MNDRPATTALPSVKRSRNYHHRTKQVSNPTLFDTAVELRYRALLEQIPAVIYTDSIETNHTLYINPQIEAVTGYTAEEWMADNLLWYKIIDPLDQDRIWAVNMLTEETGEPYIAEYRIRTRDGSSKWLHDESWLIKDADGEAQFWQGFIIDITERKQAEMELERRAAELAALQETVLYLTARHTLPDLLTLLVDRATTLLDANSGMLYLVDEEEQTATCVVSHNTHRDYCGTVLHYGEGAAGRVAKSGKPLNIRDYSKWPGKTKHNGIEGMAYRAVICAPMLWQGKVNGVLNLLRMAPFTQGDLDQLILFANHAAVAVENARLYDTAAQELEERKRAESTLRETISIYRQAIESTGGVPYYLSYEDGGKSSHFDFIGEGIQELTGYSREVFTAEIWTSMVQEARMTGALASFAWDEAIRKIRSGEAPVASWQCEYRIKARGGKIRWLVDSAVELRDENGVSHGSIGLFRDVTDAKRTEQVQQAIYRISQAVVMTASLDDVYHSIHQTLGELMPVENLYIAIYDANNDLLSFPYYVDQYDQPPPPAKPMRGLTEYVLRTKKPLWAPQDAFQKLVQEGEVEVVGSDSYDWIGVPLMVEERVTGVMVAQSYTAGVLYTQEDFDLMEFVSTQVAASIERKKAEDALRVSLVETRKQAERLALLNRIARAVSTTLNLDTLLEIVYTEIASVVPCDSFFVGLYDRQADQIEFRIRVDMDIREEPYVRPLGNALTGSVVKSRKGLLVRDYELEKEILPQITLWGTGQPSRSWLGVPMLLGEEVLGVISVQSYHPNAFGEREMELLMTVADTVAIAIENARLYEAEKRRTAQLTRIFKLGIDLALLHQEEEVLDSLVQHVAEIMDTTTCTVMLVNGDRSEAVISAQTGLPALAHKARIPLTLPALRRLIEDAEPLIVADIDRQEAGLRQILVRPDVKSFFAYPMLRGDQVIGAITLSRLDPYQPSADEVSACQLLAERAAVALENARLFEKTEHHLKQVQALRTIDAAIASSFDLRSILNIILNQITAQLEVDAADILLLNPHSYALEYSIGKGFLSSDIEKSRFLLGEGVVGQQMMERRTIHIPDLKAVIENFIRSDIFMGEGFATYSAVPLVAKGEVKGILEVYNRVQRECGAEWLEFLETLAGQVAIAIDNSQLFNNLQRSNLELSMAYDATIEGWSRALDMRDRETEGHTKRVTEVTINLARMMGLSETDLVHMRRGILLHDMGKMGIPDKILHKTEPLKEEEWKVMRMHPQYAFEMLAPIAYLRPALDIPGSHHEKYDGSGYPRGLKGEQIPLAARIFAVVDVFDALTSDRPYRKAWSKEKALQYIREERGKSFDPRVVDVFMSLLIELGITKASE